MEEPAYDANCIDHIALFSDLFGNHGYSLDQVTGFDEIIYKYEISTNNTILTEYVIVKGAIVIFPRHYKIDLHKPGSIAELEQAIINYKSDIIRRSALLS